jgi:hypothetical protein
MKHKKLSRRPAYAGPAGGFLFAVCYDVRMKIATNVHRDAFGGITISNLALFDWLEGGEDTIVGIEYLTNRHATAAVIFQPPHYFVSRHP